MQSFGQAVQEFLDTVQEMTCKSPAGKTTLYRISNRNLLEQTIRYSRDSFAIYGLGYVGFTPFQYVRGVQEGYTETILDTRPPTFVWNKGAATSDGYFLAMCHVALLKSTGLEAATVHNPDLLDKDVGLIGMPQVLRKIAQWVEPPKGAHYLVFMAEDFERILGPHLNPLLDEAGKRRKPEPIQSDRINQPLPFIANEEDTGADFGLAVRKFLAREKKIGVDIDGNPKLYTATNMQILEKLARYARGFFGDPWNWEKNGYKSSIYEVTMDGKFEEITEGNGPFIFCMEHERADTQAYAIATLIAALLKCRELKVALPDNFDLTGKGVGMYNLKTLPNILDAIVNNAKPASSADFLLSVKSDFEELLGPHLEGLTTHAADAAQKRTGGQQAR